VAVVCRLSIWYLFFREEGSAVGQPLLSSRPRLTCKGRGSSAALLVVLACMVALVGAAQAATSPKGLRAAILRAELAKRSVHYVSASSASGGRRGREVADVARNSGIQRISFSQHGKTGRETTLVLHSAAYLRGDAFALHEMGLPKSFASRYAGKWLLIPHSAPLYAPLAQDVTLGSFARNGVPRGRLSLVHGTIGGRAVRGLRGTAPASEGGGIFTVYVPKSGPPLTIEGTVVVRGAHPSTSHIALSHWNEQVHVRAPAHSVRVNTP
jgi:hypothetical protein